MEEFITNTGQAVTGKDSASILEKLVSDAINEHSKHSGMRLKRVKETSFDFVVGKSATPVTGITVDVGPDIIAAKVVQKLPKVLWTLSFALLPPATGQEHFRLTFSNPHGEPFSYVGNCPREIMAIHAAFRAKLQSIQLGVPLVGNMKSDNWNENGCQFSGAIYEKQIDNLNLLGGLNFAGSVERLTPQPAAPATLKG